MSRNSGSALSAIADEATENFYQCLEMLDLRLTQLYYQQGCYPSAPLQPFLLPEDEIEYRLAHPQGMPHWLVTTPPFMLPLESPSLNQRLTQLCERFSLSAPERDILLAGLLTTLSPHYRLLLRSLMESNDQAEVTVEILLAALTQTQTARRIMQSALSPAAPLFHHQLVRTPRNNAAVLITAPAVWRFLQGERQLEPEQQLFADWLVTDKNVWVPAALQQSLPQLWQTKNDAAPPLLLLEGNAPEATALAVARLMHEQQRDTLSVNLDKLAQTEKKESLHLLRLLLRDVCLYQSCLLAITTAPDTAQPLLETLARHLETQPLPVAILCHKDHAAPFADLFTRQPVVHISLAAPSTAEKVAMLKRQLPAQLQKRIDMETLSQRYSFYPEILPYILQEASYYRALRDGGKSPEQQDFIRALAQRSRKNFGKLAQRITPRRTLEDLVLAPAIMQQLTEITAAVKLRDKVTEVHFADKLAGKMGISALFYGESGTGKTLAAEVLANQLNTDLVKVDLSSVVNKYVGETEKNLARIFDLAEEDSGVLFFDEADALFGKRSETKDAHDRHANIEVSYLLQRLESYPGLVILATNNRSHLDSAFNRRFTFITRFTWPDDTLRQEMWRRIWPASLPLSPDADFDMLARYNSLTGANVRNIALLAAILAADEGSPAVDSQHLERALKRELGKSGRPIISSFKE